MRKMPSLESCDVLQLEDLTQCPWCGSKPEDSVFEENGWPYVQCRECTLIYLKRRLKQEYISTIYDASDYHVSGNTSAILRKGKRRLSILESLPAQSVICEDAVGDGGFLAACKQKGYQAVGCDLGLTSVSVVRKNFGISIHRGTIDSMNLATSSVDVVASFDLLSHLYAPWDYMREIRRILKPAGVWLLRTGDRSGHMRNIGWGHWSAPEHVFHYTRAVLEDMMTAACLELEQTLPAFDSAYPYFLAEYRQSLNGGVRAGAKLVSKLLTLFYNTLRLPKEDVYILARPKIL